MTIFIILMAPPLARARNSFSSDVAKVTRYKADKSKLRMGGWKASETELGREELETPLQGENLIHCQVVTPSPKVTQTGDIRTKEPLRPFSLGDKTTSSSFSNPWRVVWYWKLDSAIYCSPSFSLTMVTKHSGLINDVRPGEKGERGMLLPTCPPTLQLPNAITHTYIGSS